MLREYCVSQSVRKTAAMALAVIAGGISVLGWAPFAWWPLPLLAYALLLFLLANSRTAIQAGKIGLSFGLGLHFFGHGWVLDALHRKSGMALAPAAASTLIFVSYLALFTALPSLLWRLIVTRSAATAGSIGAFAALMTLSEWGRSLPFNGFTSLSLGYSLIDTWLAGYAPVAGVYGLSWLGYCASGSLVLLLTRRASRPALALTAVVCGGTAFLQFDWVEAAGQSLSFRLIQSNVVQERKFDPLTRHAQMLRLLAGIEQAPADLIITPETAFTVFIDELPGGTLSQLQNFSRRTGSHLLLGIPTLTANAEGHNSVIQISPGTARIQQYDKVRLMPFGEYSPAGFGWFSAALDIPLKDLRPGISDQQPFRVGAQSIGTLICHEDLLGAESRRWLPSATVLINPSNLAWFEGSIAIAQRLQIARLRALEAGRPILRATNTGVTAQIDHRGRVIRKLPEMQEGALSGIVQPMRGLTPYARFGDGPVVSACGLVSLLCLLTRRRRASPRTREDPWGRGKMPDHD